MKTAIRRLMSTALWRTTALTARAEETKPRVLILSGANNHAWQETTPNRSRPCGGNSNSSACSASMAPPPSKSPAKTP